MTASFLSFAKALGFKPVISAGAVAKELGFRFPISLWTVMGKIGAPFAPVLNGADIAGGQFHWSDPVAHVSNPSAVQVLRQASSFIFELWTPNGESYTATFGTVPSGPTFGPGAYFDDGAAGWAYNYPGHIDRHGAYSWQVTSSNDYGSTSSQVAHFGTNAPEIWCEVDNLQHYLTVYGAGFPDPTCNVVATCSGFGGSFPPGNGSGDITKGIRVTIECQNEGQIWNIKATSADGTSVSTTYNCVGGSLS